MSHEPGFPHQPLPKAPALPDLPPGFDQVTVSNEFQADLTINLQSVNISLDSGRATVRYEIGVPGLGYVKAESSLDVGAAILNVLNDKLIKVIRKKHV